MKKSFFLVIALLLLGGVAIAQKYPPLKPYKNGGYSISEVKSFILNQDFFTANYRKELLEIINEGLRSAGEKITLNEGYLYLILKNTKIEYRDLSKGYINSYKNDDRIVFFKDNKGYKGKVCVFMYNRVQITWAKDTCLNLLKIPVKILQAKEFPKPKKEIVSRVKPPDTVIMVKYIIVQKGRQYYKVPYYYYYNSYGFYLGRAIISSLFYRAYGRSRGYYSNWTYGARLSCPTNFSGRRRFSTPVHFSGRRRFSTPVNFSGRTRFSSPVHFTNCGRR